MSSNGSQPRLPPLSTRPLPSIDRSATGSQLSPQHVSPSIRHLAGDRKPSVSHRSGSMNPLPAIIADMNHGSDRRPPRPLGVHSILNPVGAEESDTHPRRRSAAAMDERAVGNASPPVGRVSSRPSSSGSDEYSDSPDEAPDARPSGPRRILTPVSPKIRRTASLSRISASGISMGTVLTGSIDAHQSPFLGDAPGSRIHTAQPGTAGIPPMPGHAIADGGHRYSLPYTNASPSAVHALPRRQSVSSVVHSTRASPAPTFHSYNRSGQASPAIPYPSNPATSTTTPQYGSGPSVASLGNAPPGSAEQDPPYGIPVVSTGQTSYQLMTISSGQGPVQVPVEVQAASRMADEKRKRNAGASARFRARRKEKEREASTRIQALETQIREAAVELDWYRKERDELVSIMRTLPGGERFLAREKSPKTRREEDTQRPRAALPQPSLTQQGHFTFDRPADTERNIRRRTESYSLPTPSSSAPAPHSYFPPTAYPSHPPAHEQPPLPPYGAKSSAGPLQSIRARPEQFEAHQGPRDPIWPPRAGPAR